MASVNKTFHIGNLTRDPELKEIKDGTKVCEFGIAVNEVYTNKQGKKVEEVSFLDVTAWDKTGIACHKYLEKGRLVHVEGKLKQERWKNDDDQNRSRVRIIAQKVQFLPRAAKQDDQ
ncbi:single-stranded DNA-binding protein [Candidatus Pacearchaeota archaeon]|nr:single-stranded DNA-binding protein [Candidatus Pacearchaeota archaeon]|tara:strand:+ start:159 stop:509 length:351 start_codon:yes stop_codon:yes gene_type:complete